MIFQWCTITSVGTYVRVCSILRGVAGWLIAPVPYAIVIGKSYITNFFLVQMAQSPFEYFSKSTPSIRVDFQAANSYDQVEYIEKFHLPMTSIEVYPLRKGFDLKVAIQRLLAGWPRINDCCSGYSVVVLANFGGNRWLNPPI